MVESDAGTRAAEPVWRKASCCAGGECVEVSEQEDAVVLRNSKDPGAVLRCTGMEWRIFLRGIKAGEFDDLG